MTYILLAAGKGTSLHPLTLRYQKASYRLNAETTVLQRMVRGIRRFDRDAEVVVVLGGHAGTVKAELEQLNVTVVTNPFHEVTSSIASLWFAREYLDRENVAILHGDAVYDDAIISEIITVPTDHPYVLMDSSLREDGLYNVVSKDGRVLVMSKQLTDYSGKYACATKLDAVSARLLKSEVESMIESGMGDQYYEDALVQMIMFHDFQLSSRDIAGCSWSEVNTVDDLLAAQNIQSDSVIG